MKRYVQFEPFKISDFETKVWNHPRHRHNHFEVICIMHGNGRHIINEHALSYQRGDLFLLRPDDYHQFQVVDKTRFIYFKFTKLYLSMDHNLQIPEHWNRKIDLLLMHSGTNYGSLLEDSHDAELVRKVMAMISKEYQRSSNQSREVIFQLFSVILTLIRCNRSSLTPKDNKQAASKMEPMLDYIDQHIYAPSQLATQKMADEFYVSPHYLGSYFKRNVGQSLSGYISNYRFKLIEQRLRYSEDLLKEIAADFGFFDASHLNKFFKKHAGINPSDYRLQVARE